MSQHQDNGQVVENGHATNGTPTTDVYTVLGAQTWDLRRNLSTAVVESLRPLSRGHIDDLLASGLSVETIKTCRFRSIEGADVTRTLQWKGGGESLGACLLIPSLDRAGNETGFARVKPDRPIRSTGKDGQPKVRKYEQPKKVPVRPYFPPMAWALIDDPAVPLLITEGEKKAVCAAQEGFACVGLCGVQCWSVPREKDAKGEGTKGKKAKEKQPKPPRELLPELAALPLAGRKVYIAFDSDAIEKAEVQWAEFSLAQTLGKVGADVLVVRFQPGEDGEKVGLDDFLCRNPAAALYELMELAQPAERPPESVKEEPNDPHLLARLYLADHTSPEGHTLRWWREWWLRWGEGAYHQVLDKEMRADLGRRAKVEFDRQNRVAMAMWRTGAKEGKPPTAYQVSTRLTADVAQALAGLVRVDGQVEQPAWLDGEGPVPADEVLVCRNGIVQLPTWASSRPCLSPLTPRLFTPNALPFDFDPEAPKPTAWIEFLKKLWLGDDDTVRALQEWFGYLLLPDTTQQKIALLVGPRRSGKGTIARVLTQLVGPGNVCSPTLAGLGTNFGLQPLLGKTLAIISDARLSARTDTAVVVERLLSISGEDGQTVDRKYMSQVTTRLPVRFTILTNELPRLDDASGALVGRLLVLRMTRTWYGREDTKLTRRLLKELPGILLWAMRGWARLRREGCFRQPAASQNLIRDLEDLSSPIGGFLRERCVVEPETFVAMADLYQNYGEWCKVKGISPKDVNVFGRDLRAALPCLDGGQKTLGAHRVRVYHSIRLKTLAELCDDDGGKGGQS